MKTKITLLIGSIALITLSFTFATVEEPSKIEATNATASANLQPVGGLFADEVVE